MPPHHDETPPTRCLHRTRAFGLLGTVTICGRQMTAELVICQKTNCLFKKTIEGTHFHRQCQDRHIDYRYAIAD